MIEIFSAVFSADGLLGLITVMSLSSVLLALLVLLKKQ
jgi:hypothetical protein